MDGWSRVVAIGRVVTSGRYWTGGHEWSLLYGWSQAVAIGRVGKGHCSAAVREAMACVVKQFEKPWPLWRSSSRSNGLCGAAILEAMASVAQFSSANS